MTRKKSSSSFLSAEETTSGSDVSDSRTTSTLRPQENQSAALVITIGYASAFTFLVIFFLLMCVRRSADLKAGSVVETATLPRHDVAGFSRASSDFSLKKIAPAESCRSVVSRYGEVDGYWVL